MENNIHKIEFKTDKGAVNINTRDINAISNVVWIREFLGLATEEISAKQVTNYESKFNELIDHQNLLQAKISDVTKTVNQLIKVQQQERALRMTGDGDSPSPQQPAQKTAQQQVKREVVSEKEPDVQSVDVMDIIPPKMSDNIWNSMTEEQQENWKQKYLPEQ